ncbi:hypothetical protein [Spiroplasma endosymbiont of Panzeria rudis]
MANINSYTDEFKKQIVALYQSGKSVSCLAGRIKLMVMFNKNLNER